MFIGIPENQRDVQKILERSPGNKIWPHAGQQRNRGGGLGLAIGDVIAAGCGVRPGMSV